MVSEHNYHPTSRDGYRNPSERTKTLRFRVPIRSRRRDYAYRSIEEEKKQRRLDSQGAEVRQVRDDR